MNTRENGTLLLSENMDTSSKFHTLHEICIIFELYNSIKDYFSYNCSLKFDFMFFCIKLAYMQDGGRI